jgi:D-sedoheptulose 7-phosphate isomerase
MDRKDVVHIPAQYKAELLSAISTVDPLPVSRAVDVLVDARTLNHRVFVCSGGASASMGSQLLCDLVKGAANNRSPRFRILALNDPLLSGRTGADRFARESYFVEHLRNVTEHGDVVMAISSSGNPANLVRALEYATAVGCRTVAITGCDGHKLAALADVPIVLPATHPTSVEDSLIVICHMIGYAFLHAESG